MVKYTDILKAVNDRIKSKFPKIPILSESDVEEKIIRPSFMTTLDGIKAEDFMTRSVDKDQTVYIYYFSTKRDKNKIENLDMIDSLTELFVENNLLKIQTENYDFNIEIYNEVEFEIVDKVLQCSFELPFNEDYSRVDNAELMEEIEFNIKKEE